MNEPKIYQRKRYTGRRVAAKRSWILPQSHFGLGVRLDFWPGALSGYLEGKRLAGKREFAATRERREKIAASAGPLEITAEPGWN